MNKTPENPLEGILLIDKPRGCTSFSLIPRLRKLSGIKKIGHCGTLDPFATGVMVFLLGKSFTIKSDQFMSQDKEYIAKIRFGFATDTYDCEGKVTESSDKIPSFEELQSALLTFQGETLQKPPMFSAKKVQGKKLYELARCGITIERKASKVFLSTELVAYSYPYATIRIQCSKGFYVRTFAHDLGQLLMAPAHLAELTRTRVGTFHLAECFAGDHLFDASFMLKNHLRAV